MNQNMSRGAGSRFAGKKVITIVIITLLVLGFGYFLFKISPEQQQSLSQAGQEFDLSGVKQISEPSAVTDSDRILGKSDAKNSLILFEDYQCPACAQTNEMLKQLGRELPDTKLVFRHFPLFNIHANAVSAAYAAEAAGEQGKYWEMSDLLYSYQAGWSDLANPLDYYTQLASQAGVGDLEQFNNSITSEKFKDKVQKDLVEALSLDVPGTPTIYFNGKVIKNDTLENMKKQAEQYLMK